jgi:hypothetical protein
MLGSDLERGCALEHRLVASFKASAMEMAMAMAMAMAGVLWFGAQNNGFIHHLHKVRL